jgi:general secretion pathway protein J
MSHSTEKLKKYSGARRGFSLVELLVALAVFATMAAVAWGGLNSVVKTRSALVHEQDDLRSLMATVDALQRDLRQAVARPVRGNYGELVAGFIGGSDRLEFTRLGFANPQAEVRSNLERVAYALDDKRLMRATYAVLDRAPGTQPRVRAMRDQIKSLRLRYLDAEQRWVGAWPEPEPDASVGVSVLPRAVEIRIDTADYGEITRTVELVADFRNSAVTTATAP